MGLVYIEYFSRRPGVGLEEFRAAAAQGQEGWDAAYGEDQLVLSLGRTWRLGPEPEYLAVWYSPKAGLERLDAWDRIFRSGAADRMEQPFFRVARIDAAGCYEPLVEPMRRRDGTYYAEFFCARGDREAIRAFYLERASRHPGFTLALLVLRLGKLGPDPGGLAVWAIPDFASLEQIAREPEGVQQPVELVMAGTYAEFGREIL